MYGYSKSDGYRYKRCVRTALDTDTIETVGYSISPISGDTTEGGQSATFSIRLTSEPFEDVIIDIESIDNGEGIATPLTLAFTPTNWSIEQTVTVLGVEDETSDGNQTYTVQLSLFSSGDDYAGMDPDDVSVVNIDNDVCLNAESEGCIKDEVNGLMWQDNGYTTLHNWSSAIVYCANLNLATFSDWVLPSENQLWSLYLRNSILSSYEINRYWSNDERNPTYAYYLSYIWNEIQYGYKTLSNNVRCVRVEY